ncbi:unnamed protein product, partial [Prorocentrum cordatum]
MKVPLHQIVGPCDGLVAGPPCPPWSPQGPRKGREDPRSDIYCRVVCWAVELIKDGHLLFVVLENVKGILGKAGASESFIEQIINVLKVEVREFFWDYVVLSAKDYG